MEISHRISIDSKKDLFVGRLRELKIDYKSVKLPGEGSFMYFFDILESDPRWEMIEEMISCYGASNVNQTYFEPEEIQEAEWSRIVPLTQRGYPQPQTTWVSDRHNYGVTCSRCGTYKQKSNFRIGQEPNPKKYDFSSLIWTYALLGKVSIFHELELNDILGFEKWDVILNKTNLPSMNVFQLYVSSVTKPGLVSGDLGRRTCYNCNVTKYDPHNRGRMSIKHEAIPLDVDIIETFEWFGWGAMAYREMLISNRFARLILEKEWKGVLLKPIEIV